MKVNVKYGLSCTGAVIDYQAVSFRIQPLFFCDFLSGQEKMADEFTVRLRHTMDLGNMHLGNNECMHGRLRIHVLESNDCIVLEYYFRRHFFFDDLAENTLRVSVHDSVSFRASEKLLKKQLRTPV
jgi:hypothetical protein